MIKNPKTCWEYEIQTDKLREPDASFHLLRYTIQHPDKTLEECCNDKGIDYGKARIWSSKYFYKERRKAYNKEMTEALQTGIIQFKQQQIKEALEAQPQEKVILQDERYYLLKDKQTRKTLDENKDPIPEYLDKQIAEKEKRYWINRKNKYNADKDIWNIPNNPVPLDEIIDDIEAEKPEIKMFMDAMKGNRDAHNKQ